MHARDVMGQDLIIEDEPLDPVEVAPVLLPGRRPPLVSAAALVVGAIGAYVGAAGVGGLEMSIRVPLVLVGLWLAHAGLGALLSRWRRRPVDLGFWLAGELGALVMLSRVHDGQIARLERYAPPPS